LYVGKFRSDDVQHQIEKHLAKVATVVPLSSVLQSVLDASKSKTYRDDPVIMTMKALMTADLMPDEKVAAKRLGS